MQTSDCPGSLLSVKATLIGMKATCPICGAEITIGYGGRLPMHLPASDESRKEIGSSRSPR